MVNDQVGDQQMAKDSSSREGKARWQTALFRLSAELVDAVNEQEIFERVVRSLRDSLGYDFVAILLFDTESGNRILAASVGYSDPPSPIEPGTGLSERPLLNGQIHYTPDVTADPRYFYGMGGSEVDVPIRIGGKVLGVLTAESKQRDAFGQDDFEVLTVAAQQTALAIENTRLVAAERRRADELDALRTTMAEVTAELELQSLLRVIVERAAELLNATGGELGLYNPQKKQIKIVVSHNLAMDYVGCTQTLGEGAMGLVAETGQPMVIDDYQKWPGSLEEYPDIHASLAVPLKVGDRLLGVFSTVSTNPEQKFDTKDVHRLNLFAQQAAIAIDNARLFDHAQSEIKERKRVEAALREHQEHLEDLVDKRTAELRHSERRYRTLFDGVPVGLYRTTADGEFMDANPALVLMLGFPNREVLLKVNTATMYVDAEEHQRWKLLMDNEGVVRDFETRLVKYDGTIIWGKETARAVKDENNQILYYEGSFEDISQRKEDEIALKKYRDHLEELVEERTRELQESEKRYRSLFDGVPVGLYRSTPDGKIIDANLALVQMLGFQDRDRLLSVETIDSHYVNPDERARWIELLNREGVIRDFEYMGLRGDGEIAWFSDTARAVYDDQNKVKYYEGSVKNISMRKQIEAELRNQKEYFEALFINSPVAVITADMDGIIVSWNPMAEQLYGYNQEEVIGRHLDDVVAHDQEMRREANIYTEQVVDSGRTARVEAITKRTRKDGSLIDVEMSALPVIVGGLKIGFIVIYVDITGLQEARRQAEAANKAKSTFLANMSHELRTPLNAILGFTQLLERDKNMNTNQLENLEIINNSGNHLLTLINDVLEMSKIEAGRETLQPRNFNLHLLLENLVGLFRTICLEKGLELQFSMGEEVPRFINADENKFRQVLINLISNSIKFTSTGRVVLRVEAACPGDDPAVQPCRLYCEVEDTGPGIPPEELETIFEPFVQATSDQVYHEGTGLGLSISREFVRLMGGELSVRSLISQGSTFSFDIPVLLVDEDLVKPLEPAKRVIGLEPGQPVYRLLIVEERESNRRLLTRLLDPLGFELREAVNGREAVELAESWEPDLIWMDLRMPVMDGYEATRRIKSTPKGRQIAIIALTASAFEDDRERILDIGCDDFVRKPFQQQEIFDMLTKHIGVQFIYEEEPAHLRADQQVESTAVQLDILTRVDPDSLPANWMDDMHEATVLAETNRMLEVIDRLGGSHDQLANTLRKLVYDFEYERILKFINEAREAS